MQAGVKELNVGLNTRYASHFRGCKVHDVNVNCQFTKKIWVNIAT